MLDTVEEAMLGRSQTIDCIVNDCASQDWHDH